MNKEQELKKQIKEKRRKDNIEKFISPNSESAKYYKEQGRTNVLNEVNKLIDKKKFNTAICPVCHLKYKTNDVMDVEELKTKLKKLKK